MNTKKFLSPEEEPRNAAYHFKNSVMDHIENTELFNSYIKNHNFNKEFSGTLWGRSLLYSS